MDFSLTEDQQTLQDAVIEFARSELAYDLIEPDRESAFSREGWLKCAKFGIQGLPIPESYGGGGADVMTTIAVMEGLGYACRDMGLIFSMNAHMWTNSIPLTLCGTEETKRKYLPGLCDGSLIGANGASEPDSGSDVFALRTRCVRDGDHFVLNGTKMFVTNAQVADLIAVYATLDPELGVMGICGFIVETDTPGVSVSKKIEKMGLRTSPMAEVVVKVLSLNKLNRRDTELLERGYYEDLTDVTRYNTQLMELFAKEPADWQRQTRQPLVDVNDPYSNELIPSNQVRHRGVTLTTNRWGMRDRDYELAKPPDTYRIALIGASGTRSGRASPPRRSLRISNSQLTEGHCMDHV